MEGAERQTPKVLTAEDTLTSSGVGDADFCGNLNERPPATAKYSTAKRDDHVPIAFNEEQIALPVNEVQSIHMSTKDHWLAIITFCLLGTTQLLIWNMVINSFVALESHIYPGNLFSDLLGGCEHAAALLVAIAGIKLNGLSVKGTHFFGGINVLFYVLFPMVPGLLGGNQHLSAAKGLLCLISIAMGISVGFLHIYGYAFATIMPKNYAGYVSTGNGVAGVYSYLIFTIFSEGVWREKDLKSQQKIIWAIFVLGAVVCAVQLVAFYILSKRPWFIRCVEIARVKKVLVTEQSLKEWGPPRSVIAVLRDCWVQTFNASFTLLITLLLFPAVGPFGWAKSYTITSSLNGAFQIVDLITRWMPALGSITLLSKKALLVNVLARPLYFVPLFMIAARTDMAFLTSTGWLFVVMVLFTVTNGWFVTLGTIYNAECVKHPQEKEIAAEIFVIGVLGSITAAIYASRILTL